MNNKLDDNKKKQIDKLPYTLLVKKSIENSSREYDEFYVYQIALYIDNLMKLQEAFPAKVTNIISLIINNVENINDVDYKVHNSKLNGNTIQMAPTSNENASQYEFFSLLTQVITKSNTFESQGLEIEDLKKTSQEYLTQIIYNVNKEPNLEYRINEIDSYEGNSTYSNKLQSNPVMSNILNLIALTSGLSINYVISSILKEDGNKDLMNKFDQVHGVGSYNILLHSLKPLLNLKAEPKSSSEKAASSSDDLFNTDYNQLITNLSEYELNCIDKIETMLLKSFFEKYKDNTDYINENLQRLENSLSTEKSKTLLKELHKERVITSVKVRERFKEVPKGSNGFLSIKMIIGVCAFILIVILLTLLFLKYI